MKEWIFKAVWMTAFIIVLTGWDQPYRWICLLGVLAFIADKAVNS